MSTYKELIKNFKRLLESWPGNHMSFARTPEWKSVFISIDSGTDSGLLDKSPMVYKSTEETVEYIWPAVEITCRIKPICNFKAAE
jgi:hypothetical protein